MTEELKPRPYDLSLPSERSRLWRECDGYLRTCERQHHGTDFEGRNYARQALAQMIEIGEPVRASSTELTQLVKAARDVERGEFVSNKQLDALAAALASFKEVE